jgi:hypothetical protein
MSTADFESARRGSIPRRGALIDLNLMSSECAGFARDPAKVEDQVRFLARALMHLIDAGARQQGRQPAKLLKAGSTLTGVFLDEITSKI